MVLRRHDNQESTSNSQQPNVEQRSNYSNIHSKPKKVNKLSKCIKSFFNTEVKASTAVMGAVLLSVASTGGFASYSKVLLKKDKAELAYFHEVQAPEKVKEALGQFGVVQNQKLQNDFIVNTIHSNSGQSVIYATKDGNYLIMGDIYDLDGRPLFNEELILNNQAGVSDVSTEEATIAQVVGEYQGEVPDVFNYLDSLGGYKEDPSKAVEDTVYVIYDPRCPYCHEMFRKTRNINLAEKGVTIKWLPTVALGNPSGENSDAEKLATQGLHIKNAEEFAQTLGGDATVPNIQVSDKDREQLKENLAMLFGSIEELHGKDHPKAVPTAFYLDKKTGKPRLLIGPNEDKALKMIFGE